MTPAQRLKLETLIAEHTNRTIDLLLARSAAMAACRKKADAAAQALRDCLDELTDKPDLRRHGDAKET